MRRHAIFLGAALLSFVSVLSYAQAPVPFINQPLIPDATPPGGVQFTLTLNGTGFVSSSIVNWNGGALATQFVSGSQLTATVPAEDIATASTASVTVVSPAPGGGTSNVAFFSVTANRGNSVGFTMISSPVGGGWSTAVVVGDFNGDSKLDLAVVAESNNTVSILLGDGTGNFNPVSSPAVGTDPHSLGVGDFNGDGKLDLVTANADGGTVSILLGDGTGNFTPASFPAGGQPYAVAVGDLNGDGKLDLATANGADGTVSILMGDGAGNFTLTSSPATGGSVPFSVAVGDFNGDGKLDLAVINLVSDNLSILLGDGTGNFTLASSPPYGGYSVAAGDFNGDGKLDLALASCGNGDCVLLGDGTGNFTLTSSPVVGSNPTQVAVGDFNGDGKLDLATANLGAMWDDYGTVSVLLGDGKGNFTLASSPGVRTNKSLAVGDFNGDGKLDLAVSQYWTGDMAILLAGPPWWPYVSLSPTTLTFGAQVLGTSSAPQPVTITNVGTANLDITRVVTSANFSQSNNCPRTVPPAGQCTVNVVFTPKKINTITGTITITDNAPKSPQTIALSGVGTVVTLLPSGLRFGKQKVGTTSPPQTVTLTNYGPMAVTIFGGDFTGPNPSSFKLQNTTCQHSLPAGGSCTINIVFVPKIADTRTATLEVNDNGGASPQTVTLIGTGTN